MIRHDGSGWTATSPAKINLFLEVLRHRDDGFHELITVVSTIGLFDHLHLSLEPNGPPRIAVDCRWLARGRNDALPQNEENLAGRAIRRFMDCFELGGTVRLTLAKRIPAAAGLGGASGNAAAALRLANRAFGGVASERELIRLGGELGSDVPLFLLGGTVVARGRGEQVGPAAQDVWGWCVVVKPPEALPTAAVYSRLRPPTAPRSEATMLAALERGRFRDFTASMFNRLEAPAGEMTERVAELRAAFVGSGLRGCQLSGSGSAYFGLAATARQARRAAARIGARGLGEAWVAPILPRPRQRHRSTAA